ncbi:hypothetical protein D3C75_701830 [compost metagenome]
MLLAFIILLFERDIAFGAHCSFGRCIVIMRNREQHEVDFLTFYCACINILVAVLDHHIIVRNGFGDDGSLSGIEHIGTFGRRDGGCFFWHITFIQQAFNEAKCVQNALIVPLEDS